MNDDDELDFTVNNLVVKDLKKNTVNNIVKQKNNLMTRLFVNSSSKNNEIDVGKKSKIFSKTLNDMLSDSVDSKKFSINEKENTLNGSKFENVSVINNTEKPELISVKNEIENDSLSNILDKPTTSIDVDAVKNSFSDYNLLETKKEDLDYVNKSHDNKNNEIELSKIAEVNSTNQPSISVRLKDSLSKLNLNKLFVAKNTKIAVLLVLLAVVFVLFMNMSQSSVFGTGESTSTTYSSLEFTSSSLYINNLENKLKNVLSKIKGAGSVSVMITLENGPELKIATSVDERSNTTTSQSTSTTNVTVVENPILISQNGKSSPLILMEIMPKIKGVIVVSAGAQNAYVKLQLLEAVQAILDVPNDNIQIYTGV